MGKVMRHTLGASLNIRHNLSSSKGPKPLQLKLLTTYIPRSEERFSRNAETELVCRLLLEKKKGQSIILITNNFRLAARTLAEVYEQRWQIEVFFRALKQNLRVKTFVGTSANAV